MRRYGHLNTARELAKFGADPNLRDSDGKTAIEETTRVRPRRVGLVCLDSNFAKSISRLLPTISVFSKSKRILQVLESVIIIRPISAMMVRVTENVCAVGHSQMAARISPAAQKCTQSSSLSPSLAHPHFLLHHPLASSRRLWLCRTVTTD